MFVTAPDESYVVRHFSGKMQTEVVELYARGMAVTEYFAYMGAGGLRYYLPPARGYLQSDRAANNREFCHGLMCSLYVQAGNRRPLPADVVDIMKDIARYCDNNRAKFHLDDQEGLFDQCIKTILAA